MKLQESYFICNYGGSFNHPLLVGQELAKKIKENYPNAIVLTREEYIKKKQELESGNESNMSQMRSRSQSDAF